MAKSKRPIRRYKPNKTIVSAADLNTLATNNKVSNVPAGVRFYGSAPVGRKESNVRLVKLEEHLTANPNRSFACTPYSLDELSFTDRLVSTDEETDIESWERTYDKVLLHNHVINARNFMFFCTEIPADAIVVSMDFGFCNEWVIVQSWCTGAEEGMCS